MNQPHAVGVDLGGTEVKIGLVTRDGRIVRRKAWPSRPQRGPERLVAEVIDAIESLREPADEIVAIGFGAPGPLSPSKGIIHRSVNLPGWTNVDLRQMVTQRAHLPVIIDNDANVAAFGEYTADPSVRDLVLLTLGTGVGAGTILDGRILHGHNENASEWGHIIVEPNGRPCNCGQKGCLEQYASATNIAKRVQEEIDQGTTSSLSNRSSPQSPITAVDVVDAARANDPLATRIWDDACRYLAIACVNIQHAVNPQRILLGGGMSSAGDFLLTPVRRHFDSLHWQLHNDHPEIILSSLGNDAGIQGAAALAWRVASAPPR